MLVDLMCLVILAASPLSASVHKETVDSCSPTEFSCGDGGCVSMELVCDGSTDCADGSDERACDRSSTNLSSGEPVIHRWKRQSACRKDQWRCRDGSCISFDGKCDGTIDCTDGSDETHALCRNTLCQHNWFRCTYGACVDGTAPCNGIKECADESDELLPRCRNETDEVRGQFKCLDGSTIPASNHCDGSRDCPDGSDETVRTCGAKTCASYLFQCAYGACVDRGANCNKIEDCADGSDEAFDLCGTGPTPATPTKKPQGSCVLPPYPNHGTYVTNKPGAKPGDGFDFITINVTCRQGYGVDGSNSVYCYNGWWPEKIPRCVSQCRLNPHPSVEYECLVFGSITGVRPCKLFEPTGAVVRPICRSPNYYSPTSLPDMRCISGSWDYTARCSPECGTVTPDGTGLILGGYSAKKGDVPWHAGIYTKTTNPYKQICGGSLISRNIIISAAHCFWSNVEGKQVAAENYAAAVGKLYRPWSDPNDEAQRSDIKEIHVPVRFQGSAANYQDDIAVVIVKVQFEYKTFIRPVCVDFDINFDRRQLQTGHSGKVAGWGLTNETSNIGSPVLKVIDLPYVDTETCIAGSPPNFRAFITSDKICAGFRNGNKAVCQGDSGGGLAFPEQDKGQDRYYLRGIVSTAPESFNWNTCNGNTYTSFTQLFKHEHFIKQFWGFEL